MTLKELKRTLHYHDQKTTSFLSEILVSIVDIIDKQQKQIEKNKQLIQIKKNRHPILHIRKKK
jgi:predicted glycosyltransferase